MRKLIQDGMLIMAALLITGSTAYAMQPPAALKIATVQKPVQKESPKPLVVAPVAPPSPVPVPSTAPAPAPVKQAPAAPQPVAPSGSCADWMAAAGITDTASANELIRLESNCRPTAVNPSSGACGLAQELPCGKSGCTLGDGACQMVWMNKYVLARYGSWAAALAFHYKVGWY